jgi:hypothetical protein
MSKSDKAVMPASLKEAVHATVDFYLDHWQLPVENYKVPTLRKNVFERAKALPKFDAVAKHDLEAMMIWVGDYELGALGELLAELLWKEITGPLYAAGHIALAMPKQIDPLTQFLLEKATGHEVLREATPAAWKVVHKKVNGTTRNRDGAEGRAKPGKKAAAKAAASDEVGDAK